MASGWKHRGVVGSLAWTVLYCWVTFRWLGGVVANQKQLYYPVSPSFYRSDSWMRAYRNNYSPYEQSIIGNGPSAALNPQHVAVDRGNPTYYRAPGRPEANRAGSGPQSRWNEPSTGWSYLNFLQPHRPVYRYPASGVGSGMMNRNDGANYYYNRRQDSAQPSSPPPTTTQRPRKKKLFVPNVWG
uniref:Uncharacterized protein n=1 Tax=Anopheles stephensi TaxID=30069 RepID=A0A182YRY4_ANOST